MYNFFFQLVCTEVTGGAYLFLLYKLNKAKQIQNESN